MKLNNHPIKILYKMMSPVFLYALLIFSACNHVDLTHSPEISASERSPNDTHRYFLKDYGQHLFIIEEITGHFVFCFDCENRQDWEDQIFEGQVFQSIDHGYVQVTSTDQSLNLVLIVPDFNRTAQSMESMNKNSSFHMDWVGVSFEPPVRYTDFTDLSWVPDNPVYMYNNVSCECVHNSSSPCGENGNGDGVDGCDVGGENAKGCSVSEGKGGNAGMSVLGTGATGGGSWAKGCSIACADGYYACCNYP